MSKDKVSRREFLSKTTMAASGVVAASTAGAAGAEASGEHEHKQSDYALRTKALVSVLTKKNIIDPAAMDAVVDFYENRVGPHIGARMVARSW
ncbi:MAG: nitrile hydratase subunit alpha, partial [Gammaproteobacteria bacterium]|nr:nitrile hydratase subunit alpha [Gammaproteobacteria bacterium]